MALIKCPKCGETISDKVVICPNCNALLDNNADTTQKPSKYNLGCGFVALILAITTVAFGFWGISNYGIIFVLLGLFIFAGACVAFNEYRKDIYKSHLAKTDYNAYQEYIEQEQQKEKETQEFLQKQKEEKTAKKYNYYKYKCPMCSSNKIVNISTAKKIVSTEMLGLASKQIGKTYQCDECKYMW